MSETVTVTDYDVCQLAEGLEVSMHGRGYVPYPDTPGPRPRPADPPEESQ